MTDTGPVVVVAGEGTAVGTPDRCEVVIGLEVSAGDATSSLRDVARLAESAMDAIRTGDAPAASIQTLNVFVASHYVGPPAQSPPSPVANYLLLVSTSGIDKIGPLLASITDVAGAALRIHSLRLTIADPEPLRREARRLAVRDAESRAGQLAEAAGMRLGSLLSITEGPSFTPHVFPMAAPMPPPGPIPTMPVEPGTGRVVVQVTATYRVEP